MATSQSLDLFIGAFQLLNIVRTKDNKVIADVTYGEHPAGVISYTPSGYMSAILTASDAELRPQELTLPAKEEQTVEHWAEVGKHTLGYAGPFYFEQSSGDGRTGDVVHGPLLTATLPSWVGSLQRRKFEFSEDGRQLILIGDLGNGVVDNLTWKRLERQDKFP